MAIGLCEYILFIVLPPLVGIYFRPYQVIHNFELSLTGLMLSSWQIQIIQIISHVKYCCTVLRNTNFAY